MLGHLVAALRPHPTDRPDDFSCEPGQVTPQAAPVGTAGQPPGAERLPIQGSSPWQSPVGPYWRSLGDHSCCGLTWTFEARRHTKTRLPVEYASTLIPDAYRSEAFFVDEREQVFAHGWVAVAVRSEVGVPGQTVVRDVAGRSVVITMNQEGEINAFLNVCRHRGSRLVREDCTLRAGRFRCPYHAWAYDLDGRCIGTPLFGGSDIPEDMQAAFDMGGVKVFDRADYSLFGVRTAIWGPLIAENFMGYYHLPWVHPELAKGVPHPGSLPVPGDRHVHRHDDHTDQRQRSGMAGAASP